VQNYPNPSLPGTLTGATLPRGAAIVIAPSARLALALVLVLALGLRVWGLTFGLPFIIQPDEPSVELRVLHMWYAGDLNPHYYVYPSLYYDMQALLAFVVAHVAAFFDADVLWHPLAHLPLFYLAGRALTAAMGALTVLVVYFIGRAFGTRFGLIAALFLAVMAQHVQQSHYVTVDAPTALFTALAAWLALRALRVGDMRDLLLAAVAAGLAAGTKYNAGVALALPLAAALLITHPWRWRLRAGILSTVICAVTFVLTTPYALLDRGGPGRPWPFLNSLQVVARHYAGGHPGAEGTDNALWYVQYLWSTGMMAPMTLLALAGVAVMVVRFRRPALVLLAFVVPYYALLSSTYVRFDRNLLPLLPFLALFAAAAADALIPPLAVGLRNRVAAYALVLGAAALPSALVAAQADFAITHPFSEQVAVAWADAHLPAGASMATENWEGRSFELSSRSYDITNLPALAAEPYSWFAGHHIRYIVADSYTDGAYLADPGRYPLQVSRYHTLFARARLLARISGDSPWRPGPTMSIYQIE
jgi:4-amino-4-deoxy-L-arabinose transferase-like glycosyltransferase